MGTKKKILKALGYFLSILREKTLQTLEEVEANTTDGYWAGAGAVSELNNKLGNCSIEQEGEDFYIVGADSVRKKLGSGNYRITATFAANVYGSSGWGTTTRFAYTITVQNGKVSCPDLSKGIYNPVAEISWSASQEAKPTIRLESLAVSKI